MKNDRDFGSCGSFAGGGFQDCYWTFARTMGCAIGQPATCKSIPKFLEAEPSDFHDEALVKATRKINEILAEVSSERGAPSLLLTRQGVLLAWVNHGAEHSPDDVTADSDDETVAKALRLIA